MNTLHKLAQFLGEGFCVALEEEIQQQCRLYALGVTVDM